jgi:hypothetical protein
MRKWLWASRYATALAISPPPRIITFKSDIAIVFYLRKFILLSDIYCGSAGNYYQMLGWQVYCTVAVGIKAVFFILMYGYIEQVMGFAVTFNLKTIGNG